MRFLCTILDETQVKHSLSFSGDPVVILRCIVLGFFANAARLHHSGSYRYVVCLQISQVKRNCWHLVLLSLFKKIPQDFTGWSRTSHPPEFCALCRETSKMVSRFIYPVFIYRQHTDNGTTWHSTSQYVCVILPSGLFSTKWCRRLNTSCVTWPLLSHRGWWNWLHTFTSRPR